MTLVSSGGKPSPISSNRDGEGISPKIFWTEQLATALLWYRFLTLTECLCLVVRGDPRPAYRRDHSNVVVDLRIFEILAHHQQKQQKKLFHERLIWDGRKQGVGWKYSIG